MFIRMNVVFWMAAAVFVTISSNHLVFASATVVKEAVSVAFGESLAGREILEGTTIARMEKLVLERVGASAGLSAETRALFSAAGALGAVNLVGRPDAQKAIDLVKSVVGSADLDQLPALTATEMALIEARAEAGISPLPALPEPTVDAVEAAMRSIVKDPKVKAGIIAMKSPEAKELTKLLLQDVARDRAAGQVSHVVAVERADAALVANRDGDFLNVGAVTCVRTYRPESEAGFYALVSAVAKGGATAATKAKAMVEAAVARFGISTEAAVRRIGAMCGADPKYNCNVFQGSVCAAVAGL